MAVLPVALVTSALWWWVGVAAATVFPRNPSAPGPLRPQTFYAGTATSHIDVSLGLTSPDARHTVGTVAGLLMPPLVTRACVAAQAGLGQALLWDVSALHRWIIGLEQERDTARARTVAARPGSPGQGRSVFWAVRPFPPAPPGASSGSQGPGLHRRYRARMVWA